jgi:hypothetical protein
MKEKLGTSFIAEGLHRAFARFHEDLSELRYADIPNYKALIAMFEGVVKDEGETRPVQMDWVKKMSSTSLQGGAGALAGIKSKLPKRRRPRRRGNKNSIAASGGGGGGGDRRKGEPRVPASARIEYAAPRLFTDDNKATIAPSQDHWTPFDGEGFAVVGGFGGDDDGVNNSESEKEKTNNAATERTSQTYQASPGASPKTHALQHLAYRHPTGGGGDEVQVRCGVSTPSPLDTAFIVPTTATLVADEEVPVEPQQLLLAESLTHAQTPRQTETFRSATAIRKPVADNGVKTALRQSRVKQQASDAISNQECASMGHTAGVEQFVLADDTIKQQQEATLLLLRKEGALDATAPASPEMKAEWSRSQSSDSKHFDPLSSSSASSNAAIISSTSSVVELQQAISNGAGASILSNDVRGGSGVSGVAGGAGDLGGFVAKQHDNGLGDPLATLDVESSRIEMASSDPSSSLGSNLDEDYGGEQLLQPPNGAGRDAWGEDGDTNAANQSAPLPRPPQIRPPSNRRTGQGSALRAHGSRPNPRRHRFVRDGGDAP